MNATKTIAGHECNLILSKDGSKVREACVLIGPADRAGFRSKDGAAAREARKAAKMAVAAELGIHAARVRVVSRFTELTARDDGLIVRRDAEGRVVGAMG